MRRTSSASSTGSPSTPVVSRQWGSQRDVEVDKQLFWRSMRALERLRALPGMARYEELAARPASAQPPHLRYSLDVVPSEHLIDPVSLLRRMLRLGAPFAVLYNAFASRRDLERLPELGLDECLDVRQAKHTIYLFLKHSSEQLNLDISTDLFTITQVFNDSVAELLRPLWTLDVLLARLDPMPAARTSTDPDGAGDSPVAAAGAAASAATIPASVSASIPASIPASTVADATAAPRLGTRSNSTASSIGASTLGATGGPGSGGGSDQRSNVVSELLQTERKYVQDLETLLVYHDAMLNIHVPRETVAKICPGLPKLVEFQRRFLVGCEFQAHEFAGEEQNFGWLFLHMRAGFDIYSTQTLGQKEALQTVTSEAPTLARLSHILEPQYELPATLIKPVQRILRYPMLLKEILKNTPQSWRHYAELRMALDVMREMVADVNELHRRAENQFTCRDLQDRVKDWKGLEMASMGDLLLHGTFPVSMGDAEQEYSLFLFERVLLCFRDRVAAKKTPLTKMRPSANSASSLRNSKSLSLELKGRIYLSYITAVSTMKLATGGYLLRLGWGYANDASEHGGFELRLANEELAQMWESTIQKLASLHRTGSTRSSRSNSVTSMTYNARASQTSLSQLSRFVTTNVGSIEEDYSPGGTHARAAAASGSTSSNAGYLNHAGSGSGSAGGGSGSGGGGGGYSRRPSSFRNSSGGILFWDDAPTPTPSSSVDALRKLSVSSTSSQQSGSGGSGTSRTSLTLGGPQNTPPHAANGASSAAGLAPAASYRGVRPALKTTDSSVSLTNPAQRKVRVHVQGDTFVLLVMPDLRFDQLVTRVERKLKLCGKMSVNDPASNLAFEYLDEDEDRVRLESDEDLLVAFEAVPNYHELTIYVNS